MNEEQVRRIIREEIRSAFESMKREASYREGCGETAVREIFDEVLRWRMRDEPEERAPQIDPMLEPSPVRNPFED